MNTNELRKIAKCVFITVSENVAKDIADKLNAAASEIDRLRIELSIIKCKLEKYHKNDEKDIYEYIN